MCIKNAFTSDLDVIIALSLADAGPRRLPLWVILQGIILLLIGAIDALIEPYAQLLRLDSWVMICGSLSVGWLGRQGDHLLSAAILDKVRGLELVQQSLTALLELMNGQGAHTYQVVRIICNRLLPLIHHKVQLFLALRFLRCLNKHWLFNYVIWVRRTLNGIFGRVISDPTLKWGLIYDLLRAGHLARNNGPDRWTYLKPANLLDLDLANLAFFTSKCEAPTNSLRRRFCLYRWCGSLFQAPLYGALNLSSPERRIPLLKSYGMVSSFFTLCALDGSDATWAEDRWEEELCWQECSLM